MAKSRFFSRVITSKSFHKLQTEPTQTQNTKHLHYFTDDGAIPLPLPLLRHTQV